MQQGFAVARQIGVDHQFQPRQVKATCRDIGGDTDPGAAIAHRLQRVSAFVLAQLPRQRHHGKTTVVEPRHQVVDGGAGRTEHQRIFRLVKPQHVDDGVFAVGGGNLQRAVFDIDVLAAFTGSCHPHRIALVALRQSRDGFGDGGGKHQGAAVFGGRLQDEFQVFAKAQIQHLIGFIQHGGAQAGHIEAAAFDMVAQAARGTNDDMGPPVQRALFGTVIHATNAGRDVGPGFGIEPLQLALHLQRQFAGGGDDQRQGCWHIGEPVGTGQKLGCQGNAKRHGFARPGLGRHQRISVCQIRCQHRQLHRCQFGIPTLFQCQAKRRNNAFELCHASLSEL